MLRFFTIVCLAALFAFPLAYAGDGAVLINQDAALAGGISPGDPAGFPILITEPGLYRLVGNLDTRDQPEPWNLRAIEIRANGVTLNLGGFSIIGPSICSGTTPCTPGGTGMGIIHNDSSDPGVMKHGLHVSNGTIRGFSAYGVVCDDACRLENLTAFDNGYGGVLLLNQANKLTNSTIYRNGAGVFGSGIIRDNTVYDNLEDGIFANPRSTVIDNAVYANGGNGIRCAGCSLRGNLSTGNGGYGAVLLGSSALAAQVSHNNFTENDLGDVDVQNVAVFATAPNVCNGPGGTMLDCDLTP